MVSFEHTPDSHIVISTYFDSAQPGNYLCLHDLVYEESVLAGLLFLGGFRRFNSLGRFVKVDCVVRIAAECLTGGLHIGPEQRVAAELCSWQTWVRAVNLLASRVALSRANPSLPTLSSPLTRSLSRTGSSVWILHKMGGDCAHVPCSGITWAVCCCCAPASRVRSAVWISSVHFCLFD